MKFLKSFVGVLTISVLASACAKHEFTELETTPINQETEDISEAPPEPKAPTLVFVQVPTGPVTTGQDVNVVYDVIPGSAPIVSIVCKVDGVVVPCSIDGDTLVVSQPMEGSHNVEIVVTDSNNLQDSGAVNWDAFDKFKKVKSPLVVAGEAAQVDILVVIDNSGSMKDEQKNMAQKISNLLDRVNGLDWQIGIVTTDMVDKTLGDGRLLKFPNGSYFITSKLSLSTAKDQFAKTIQRAEKGNYIEQGIKGTYRAIERAFNPKETNDKYNQSFFRKKAALAVVVVSDEDESGTAFENSGTNLIDLVAKNFSLEKIFKFHSIIVRPGDKACLAISPSEHVEGKAYAALTAATGGILGDLCAKDYSNQLTVIGQDVANTQNTFPLTCVPMDINADGSPDVKVTSTSITSIPNFIIEDDKIIFSKPPKKGSYTLEYFCPK
jgi:hypothetical protein